MLINLSNHPFSQWPEKQLEAAKKQYGDILDMAFPDVDPKGDETYIEQLADSYAKKVLALTSPGDAVVHIMGEMTLTYAIVHRLQAHHIQCVASTTRRIVTLREDNIKEAKFEFVKFRSFEHD